MSYQLDLECNTQFRMLLCKNGVSSVGQKSKFVHYEQSGNKNQEDVKQREVLWGFTPLWYFFITNKALGLGVSEFLIH